MINFVSDVKVAHISLLRTDEEEGEGEGEEEDDGEEEEEDDEEDDDDEKPKKSRRKDDDDDDEDDEEEVIFSNFLDQVVSLSLMYLSFAFQEIDEEELEALKQDAGDMPKGKRTRPGQAAK